MSLRDRPDSRFERVLIDWDSLDPGSRKELLAALLDRPGSGLQGLHSY